MKNFIRLCILNPVAILALVMLTIVFGIVALKKIPIQMTPDIDKPILQVRVSWPGASPADVEREIITRLERSISSLSGVEKIESDSRYGSGRVTLTYNIGENIDNATIKLLNRISTINGLPEEASKPVVRTSNSEDSPISRLVLIKTKDSKVGEMTTLGDLVEFEIIENLSRIEGVSEVTFRGGSKKELKISVDMQKLANFGININSLVNSLKNSSAQLTAGELIEGKRTYTLRAESIAYTPESAQNIIIKTDNSSSTSSTSVKLGDVANIFISYKDPTSFRRINGEDAITFAVLREPGANVVKTMELLNKEIKSLNKTNLNNKGLELYNVYDETVYINNAIDLVQQNIIIGGILAICVLMIFLRNLRPTLIIMFAIPVSVVGTFVMISSLGLSINVISLAGLAFAVGMVVDASIVSQENIYRLNQSGLNSEKASLNGALQVWKPILGSALTTVVVFIPVLMVDLPVGQLFRDIAVAISVSVVISVLVSLTLIPTMANISLRRNKLDQDKIFKIPVIDNLANNFKTWILKYIEWSLETSKRGLTVIFSIILISFIFVFSFIPPLDYLPDGNRNFVFARIIVPPGYNKEATLEIARAMEKSAQPLWEKKTDVEGEKPKISRFFFVAYSGGAFAGAATENAKRVKEILPILTNPVRAQPGARAFAQQASLFGRSVGGSRSIRVNITGPSLKQIKPVSQNLFRAIRKEFPPSDGHQVRSIPTLNNGVPQVVIKPNNLKLSEYGISAREFATVLDVYNDGLRVSEVPFEGRLIDMTLLSSKRNFNKIDDLENFSFVTNSGENITLSQVADLEIVGLPNQIKRLSGKRVLSIQLRPNEEISLEESIKVLNDKLIKPLNSKLPKGVFVNISGAASELERTWNSMQQNVLIAIFVIFILLTILMKSFILPLIVLVIVPSAAVGGIMALIIINLFIKQPLDMLTMLGFIILTGVVVNNSILMVEQTVWHKKYENLTLKNCIMEATKNRIRPIFMSTLTSLFGLTPLLLFPGAGSELYRGIGAVIFGGLTMSTLLTFFMIPPLLMIALRYEKSNVI